MNRTPLFAKYRRALLALSALALTFAAAATADPPRIGGWHKIGNVDIGMTKDAVIYRYGYGLQAGCSTQTCMNFYRYDTLTYDVPGGGRIGVDVGTGTRVISFWTTSPRYKTAEGIGVGSPIPLTATRTWDGFTLGHDRQPALWHGSAKCTTAVTTSRSS
jgi:hypothetical protein